MSKSLSRKELAALATERRGDEVTTEQIRKNEKRWGLLLARLKDVNARVIRYDRTKAIFALTQAGVI